MGRSVCKDTDVCPWSQSNIRETCRGVYGCESSSSVCWFSLISHLHHLLWLFTLHQPVMTNTAEPYSAHHFILQHRSWVERSLGAPSYRHRRLAHISPIVPTGWQKLQIPIRWSVRSPRESVFKIPRTQQVTICGSRGYGSGLSLLKLYILDTQLSSHTRAEGLQIQATGHQGHAGWRDMSLAHCQTAAGSSWPSAPRPWQDRPGLPARRAWRYLPASRRDILTLISCVSVLFNQLCYLSTSTFTIVPLK